MTKALAKLPGFVDGFESSLFSDVVLLLMNALGALYFAKGGLI